MPLSLGLATRFCDENGNWSTVDVSSCRSRVFQVIEEMVCVKFVSVVSFCVAAINFFRKITSAYTVYDKNGIWQQTSKICNMQNVLAAIISIHSNPIKIATIKHNTKNDVHVRMDSLIKVTGSSISPALPNFF